MESTVIVALPAMNDATRKVSSETEPHITLLYLGADADNEAILGEITSFLEHASITSMKRFMLDVDRRDTLGDKDADVLFFKDSDEHDMGRLKEFRNFLLGNETIRTAYDSVEQFPQWIPHLTLGYPDAPADDEDNHISPFVYFDRIAFWSGNYDGPSYQLRDYEDNVPAVQHTSESFLSTIGVVEPVSSDSFLEQLGLDSRTQTERVLEQSGIKGMRWGFRRTQAQLASGAPATSGKPSGAQTKKLHGAAAQAVADKKAREEAGGKGSSYEAARAAQLKAKAAEGGVKALSNKELQELNSRIELEKKYAAYRAANPTGKEKAKKLAGEILLDVGKEIITGNASKHPLVSLGRDFNKNRGLAFTKKETERLNEGRSYTQRRANEENAKKFGSDVRTRQQVRDRSKARARARTQRG